MKTIKIFVLAAVLATLFSSCQSASDPKQVLSNKETRREIMDTIVNNSEMMKEMSEAMMNNKNSKMMILGNEKMTMMMMENRGTMMKMMKNNPEIMQRMLSDMMETAKGDTGMMSGMYKTMTANRQMMDMMQKPAGDNEGTKMMNGMNKMEGMENKTDNKDAKKSHQ